MSVSKKVVNNRDYLSLLGWALVIFGTVLIFWIYLPAAEEEVKYLVRQSQDLPVISEPIDKDFSIQVPSLAINAPIVAGVDPFNAADYQLALTRGVAHADGSALPGAGQGIFLFAHSSADLFLATRYNSIFYLLHKLQAGDEINLWYQGQEYRYTVTDNKVVPPTHLSSFQSPTSALTLMTCWPPGTTFQRRLVLAEPVL